jgi:hypothetical protein
MFRDVEKQERSPLAGLFPLSFLAVIHIGFLEARSILYNVYQYLRVADTGHFGEEVSPARSLTI